MNSCKILLLNLINGIIIFSNRRGVNDCIHIFFLTLILTTFINYFGLRNHNTTQVCY